MALITGKPTSVNLGGVDLSGFVADAGIELSPWQESVLDIYADGSVTLDLTSFWEPRTFVFRGTWLDLHPDTQAYFRRLFADAKWRRLSRMRAAYRARRR